MLDKTDILLKVALNTINLTLIINYLKIVHHSSIKAQDKWNSIHELIIESGLCLITFVDLHLLFFIPPATRHQGHIVLPMSVFSVRNTLDLHSITQRPLYQIIWHWCTISGTIKGRTHLISTFTALSILELCPFLL